MWIVCITSVRHVLTVNGYGGRQTKENEKSWCFKGWETLVNDLRPSTYSVDNVEWQQYSKTLLAPATANKLRFEVRTYKEGDNSGFIYFDDFEVVEVKE